MATLPIAVIAEKNPVLGEAIADTLEVLGFETVLAPSESAATAALTADEPALLVCDANFGRVPAPYAYVRATLAQVPYLPIVIASTPGDPVPPDLQGRIAIAEKPFGKRELVEGVHAAKAMAEAVDPEDAWPRAPC